MPLTLFAHAEPNAKRTQFLGYTTRETTYVPTLTIADQTSLTCLVRPAYYQSPLAPRPGTTKQHLFFMNGKQIGGFDEPRELVLQSTMKLIVTLFPRDPVFSYHFCLSMLRHLLPHLKYLLSKLHPLIMRGKDQEGVAQLLQSILKALNVSDNALSNRASRHDTSLTTQFGFFKPSLNLKTLPNDYFLQQAIDALKEELQAQSYTPEVAHRPMVRG